MRLFTRLSLCCISLLGLAITLAAQTPALTSADDSAIHQLVNNYLGAREHNDAKALASLFTPEADQLVSSGEWRKGRESVVKGTLASSRNTGGNRTITIQNIRLITPDVAVADGRYELTGLKGGVTRSMWSTFVVKRESNGWRIAAIRNMLPATPAPTR